MLCEQYQAVASAARGLTEEGANQQPALSLLLAVCPPSIFPDPDNSTCNAGRKRWRHRPVTRTA